MAKIREQFDIIYHSETETPVIKNGDFDVFEATNQHIGHVVYGEKGDFRGLPIVGAGVRDVLKEDSTLLKMRHEVQKQLELDGVVIEQLKVHRYMDEHQWFINGFYKDTRTP